MRRIGQIGVYEDVIEILYPGEMAHGRIAISETGEESCTFLVEPEPGLLPLLRRLRFRVEYALGMRRSLWEAHVSGPGRYEIG